MLMCDVRAVAVPAASSLAFAPFGSQADDGNGWGSFGPAFVENPERQEVCVEDPDVRSATHGLGESWRRAGRSGPPG